MPCYLSAVVVSCILLFFIISCSMRTDRGFYEKNIEIPVIL